MKIASFFLATLFMSQLAFAQRLDPATAASSQAKPPSQISATAGKPAPVSNSASPISRPAQAATNGVTPTSPVKGTQPPVQTSGQKLATPPVQAAATAASAPTQSPSAIGATTSPVETLLNEDLIRSLRDPFQLPSILLSRKETPKTDLEVYPLKDFKLNGVITGPKKTRAMVTTPNNKVFFVRVGDKIGVRDGTVTQILPDSIKIEEHYVDEHGKRMPDIFELTMSGDLVSLNKKEE